MTLRRNHRGFTLMEMLIVVAIIAILVAIAIPVFSGQLEKAREATCTANRRSLQSVVLSAFMVGKADGEAYKDTNAAYADVFTGNAAAQDNYICPDKGVFSWKQLTDQVGYVTCSKHGAKSGAAAMQALAEEIKLGEDSKLFTEYIDAHLASRGAGVAMNYPLPDSVYFEGWSKSLIEQAAKLGMQLDSGSWRIQRWNDGNYSLYQYDGNVMECTSGSRINATKWTITTTGDITCQTGSVNVVTNKYTESKVDKYYSAIGTDFKKAS